MGMEFIVLVDMFKRKKKSKFSKCKERWYLENGEREREGGRAKQGEHKMNRNVDNLIVVRKWL